MAPPAMRRGASEARSEVAEGTQLGLHVRVPLARLGPATEQARLPFGEDLDQAPVQRRACPGGAHVGGLPRVGAKVVEPLLSGPVAHVLPRPVVDGPDGRL